MKYLQVIVVLATYISVASLASAIPLPSNTNEDTLDIRAVPVAPTLPPTFAPIPGSLNDRESPTGSIKHTLVRRSPPQGIRKIFGWKTSTNDHRKQPYQLLESGDSEPSTSTRSTWGKIRGAIGLGSSNVRARSSKKLGFKSGRNNDQKNSAGYQRIQNDESHENLGVEKKEPNPPIVRDFGAVPGSNNDQEISAEGQGSQEVVRRPKTPIVRDFGRVTPS